MSVHIYSTTNLFLAFFPQKVHGDVFREPYTVDGLVELIAVLLHFAGADGINDRLSVTGADLYGGIVV